MRVKSFSSLFIIMAILFVIAVAAEVFVRDLRPSSLFEYLIISTLITGIFASAIIEKIDAKILE